ncbi:MAG: Rrf2 family transcriptional regulator [Acidobacteria bacterium]|nr:Rrf2 family transcriptional regulator [Acidobacteriota bacterium]
MSLLAAQPDRRMTSTSIAASIRTNPVVVRRLLGLLRRSGLVDVSPGPHGGATLLHAPETMSLRQVYEAVEHAPVIALHPGTSDDCPVGRYIATVLAKVADSAEQALLAQLGTQSVADVVRSLSTAR